MIKLINRELVLAKVETTVGTDVVPTVGSNAMFVEGLGSWALEGNRMIERPMVKLTLGALKHLHGGTLISITFQKEVKGSGALGTAPEIGVLLRGCGFLETVNASTSVVYTPASTGHKALTIYFNEDGSLYKLLGARGNVSFSMEAGGRVMATFTFTGHFSGPTDVAIATPTYESTLPPIFIGAAVAMGAYTPTIQSFSFDMGNKIITPADANATDGYGEIRLIGRDVSGSLNPESALVATKDFIGIFRAGTVETFTTGLIGGTSGNRVKFDFAAMAYREPAPGDRDGIRTIELGVGFAESSSGDDEVTITFT